MYLETSLARPLLPRLCQQAVVLATITAVPSLYAQVETAQVSGTVTDPTGAFVVGASIVVHNTETGFERTATTNSKGGFQVVELPAGNYLISISAPSFGAFQEKTVLTVGQPLTVDAKLSAQSSSTVEVSADTAVASLNTTNSEVSQTITPEQIVNLPSLTRNPYDFVALSGNVATDATNGSQSRGVGAALGGGRSSGTEVLLDGVENVNLYTQTVGQTIPLDAVQEYKIITSGFDARFGRASGGVVNLTTRTGTNSIHGSAYEYNRISALASNTYYEDAKIAAGIATPQDHFVRNQFGYSFGAPILKNKMFAFSSTEWERIRSSTTRNYVVPTSTFLATTASNTQAFFTQYGKLKPGLILGPTYTIPATATTPIFPNALQSVTYVVPAATSAGTPQNTWFTDDRLDYTVSRKISLYYRAGLYSQNIFAGASSNSPYQGYDTGSAAYDQSHLFSLTDLVTDHLINVFKFSFNRYNDVTPLGANPAGPTLYTTGGTTTDAASHLNIALPGYLPFSPGSAIPAGGPENFYQFFDDVEWIVGKNDFHFGGGFQQLRDNRTFGAYENSVNQLSGKNEADGFNNLVLGREYQFSAAIYPQGELPCANSLTTGLPVVTTACTLKLPLSLPNFERNNTFNDGSAYVQDAVKLSSRLTVTAGLRWEYFGVQHNHDPNLESNFFLGSGTTYQQQFRNGNLLTTPNSPIHGLYGQQFHNFAPRLSFAYDVFGDAKYTVRGGYGISYERNFGNVTYNVIQNAPAYGVVSLTAQNAGGTDVASLPITTDNFGPLAGSTGSKAFPIISLRPVKQDIPTAYQQNYNLAIAHEFGPGELLEISYAGARGIHLYSIANVNRSYFGGNYLGDTRVANRLQPQYGAANLRGANGDSYYNAVNLRAEFDRFRSAGLHFTLNYTVAHSLDDNSSTFDDGASSANLTGFLGYLDPFNPRSSFGNSDFDVRQRVAISAIYEPTFLKNHGQLLKQTLGGLTFAPIITGQTGTAFNVWDNSNTDSQAEPNIIHAPGLNFHGSSVANGGIDNFNYIAIPLASKNPGVNPVNGRSDLPCSASTPGCTFTNGMDRNQFYGPGVYNVNLGAYKTFSYRERYKLQFRGEFYNLFNHSNYYVDTGAAADYATTTTLNANTKQPVAGYLTTAKGSPGGVPGSTSDERRNVQLAVRFEF